MLLPLELPLLLELRERPHRIAGGDEGVALDVACHGDDVRVPAALAGQLWRGAAPSSKRRSMATPKPRRKGTVRD